jgi:hypothetical protein
MSIVVESRRPNPPIPGQPLVITFTTPQSNEPVPTAKLRSPGANGTADLPVRRTKDGKWEVTVTATATGSGVLSLAQGTGLATEYI